MFEASPSSPALSRPQFLKMMKAHFMQLDEFNSQMLASCAGHLQQIAPTACELTWDNATNYDDNSYYSSTEDIALHLTDAQGNKLKLAFGDQSDLDNAQYEYIRCIEELVEEVKSELDDDDIEDEELLNRAAALFGQRYRLPAISSIDDIQHLTTLMSSMIALSKAMNSDAVCVASHHFARTQALAEGEPQAEAEAAA